MGSLIINLLLMIFHTRFHCELISVLYQEKENGLLARVYYARFFSPNSLDSYLAYYMSIKVTPQYYIAHPHGTQFLRH